ncbi:MAG: hypothetical protein AB1664_16575 [Thermodesulfobacteriota bacterium]
MTHARSTGQVDRTFFLVVLLLVAIGCGLFWARGQLVPFFMSQPLINGIILALAIIALGLSLAELVPLLAQSRRLDGLVEMLKTERSGEALAASITDLKPGLVKNRCERIIHAVHRAGARASEAARAISDADMESAEVRGSVVRYIIGVMVFLGLMGTFWGLLITVSGVKDVLNTLDPQGVEDAAAFVTQLKSSIGGLLDGMSTAFSTSLFGLGGSIVLGFVDVQTRQARARFLADLDTFVVSLLIPGLFPGREALTAEQQPLPTMEPVGGRLYHLASQETLGENLRRLAEVISIQGATDEKITETVVELRGVLETLKEQQKETREALQHGNQMRQGLLERVDNLTRHMERMIKEARLGREGLDDVGKALLDQMKLQGEITNKTLSLGFSDLTTHMESSESSDRKQSGSKKGSS